jgi:hypothetical protein
VARQSTDRSWQAITGKGVAARRAFWVGFERGGSRGRGSPAWGDTRGLAPSVGARVASATSNAHPVRHPSLRVTPMQVVFDLCRYARCLARLEHSDGMQSDSDAPVRTTRSWRATRQ